MKLSEIRTLKTFCDNLFSEPNWREVLENVIGSNSTDFEVNNVRFISDDDILKVLQNELEGDTYILGCFNASFLAGIVPLPEQIIEIIQKAEAFEGLGQYLIDGDFVGEIAEDYASADGYGYHFNHYDGNSEEITIGGTLYHVFDNH